MRFWTRIRDVTAGLIGGKVTDLRILRASLLQGWPLPPSVPGEGTGTENTTSQQLQRVSLLQARSLQEGAPCRELVSKLATAWRPYAAVASPSSSPAASILVPATEHCYFVAMCQWLNRKGCSSSGRSLAPIADSFRVATMERKHRTALASVLPYYGWVSLIF
jgi:hypothetical protein